MQFIQVKKIENSSFSIDWGKVNTLSLEERLHYFVKLAAEIVSEKVVDPVEIGDGFRINRRDKNLFCTCFDEYFSCLKELNKQAYKKKIAELASHVLPKKVYNALTNNNISSVPTHLNQLVAPWLGKKRILERSVIAGIFAVALLAETTNEISRVSAAAVNVDTKRQINDVSLTDFPLQTSGNIDIENSVDLASINSGVLYLVGSSDSKDEAPSLHGAKIILTKTEDVSLAFLPSDEEIENSLEKEDLVEATEEISVSLDAGEKVALLPEDNYDIIPGYHYTEDNITYFVTEEEFRILVYVVWRASNLTYEDALGVISVILNRMEDDRFSCQDLISVVSQFSVWNEERAYAFASSPDPNCPETVWNAVYDALCLGIRNNDYTGVEFKRSGTSDYTSSGERKIQIVPNGNKYYNLANNLGRVDIHKAQLQISEIEGDSVVLSLDPVG